MSHYLITKMPFNDLGHSFSNIQKYIDESPALSWLQENHVLDVSIVEHVVFFYTRYKEMFDDVKFYYSDNVGLMPLKDFKRLIIGEEYDDTPHEPKKKQGRLKQLLNELHKQPKRKRK